MSALDSNISISSQLHLPARRFFTIYSYHPVSLYLEHFKNARLLINWMGVKAPSDMPLHTGCQQLPDACAACRGVFGNVLSGRLRSGCHRCPAGRTDAGPILLTDYYALQQLQILTGYSRHWIEYFIADAIFQESLNGYRDTRDHAASSGRWVHSPEFKAVIS